MGVFFLDPYINILGEDVWWWWLNVKLHKKASINVHVLILSWSWFLMSIICLFISVLKHYYWHLITSNDKISFMFDLLHNTLIPWTNSSMHSDSEHQIAYVFRPWQIFLIWFQHFFYTMENVNKYFLYIIDKAGLGICQYLFI